MLWSVVVYLGLAIWPVSLAVRDASRLKRVRLGVFVVQLVGLALMHWYWVQLGRANNPDRLHLLFFMSGFGILCTVLQGSLFAAALVGSDNHQRRDG